MTTYQVNEIFYSIQGEGMRTGIPHAFVRFAGCNLTCSADDEEVGFDCDTEFASGRPLEADQIIEEIRGAVEAEHCENVLLTGGEPLLQVDSELLFALSKALKPQFIAIETNGTRELPRFPRSSLWVTCSPKTAEHTLRIGGVNEIKYVRRHGQAIPKPARECQYKLISPAVQPDGMTLAKDMRWCVDLVKLNPGWRLTTQLHKSWGVR